MWEKERVWELLEVSVSAAMAGDCSYSLAAGLGTAGFLGAVVRFPLPGSR